MSSKGNCKFWPKCKKGSSCEWKHGASANSEDLSERVKSLEKMLSSKDPQTKIAMIKAKSQAARADPKEEADGRSTTQAPKSPKTRPCLDFAKGDCAYGENCKFRHDAPVGQGRRKKRERERGASEQAEPRRRASVHSPERDAVPREHDRRGPQGHPMYYPAPMSPAPMAAPPSPWLMGPYGHAPPPMGPYTLAAPPMGPFGHAPPPGPSYSAYFPGSGWGPFYSS